MYEKNELPERIFITSVIFVFIGICLILGGIVSYIDDLNFKKTAVETNAIITKIDISQNARGKTIHRVYVKFFVNGRDYDEKLSHWYSGMAEGQDVKVYYNPNNPRIFRSDDIMKNLIFILMGIICFLAGFASLYMERKRAMLKKILLVNGRRVMATFDKIIKVPTMHKCWVSKLICRYKDETTGKVYLFKSEKIWVKLPKLGDKQKLLVPVYVSYDDSKYYVAVDEFFESIARD